MVKVAVLSGLRLGELLSLRWQDIDLDQGELHVKNSKDFTTKSKRNRVIPMNTDLQALLVDWREESGAEFPLVFHREGGLRWRVYTVSLRFKQAVKRSGLPSERIKALHFHSLRHTFATWLLQRSVPIYTVSRLLGHASVKTTEIYSHAVPNNFRGDVEKISLGK